MLNYLFLGDKAPACLEAADSNDDGALDLSDGVFVLAFLFLDGPAPPPPGPPGMPCGLDARGPLGCGRYAGCGA